MVYILLRQMEIDMSLSMTVGRDYRTNSKYEYVIFEGEKVVARLGFFTYSSQAKRAGQKKAAEIYAERDAVEPQLAL
jgi:hypothetical protein